MIDARTPVRVEWIDITDKSDDDWNEYPDDYLNEVIMTYGVVAFDWDTSKHTLHVGRDISADGRVCGVRGIPVGTILSIELVVPTGRGYELESVSFKSYGDTDHS